MQYNPENTSLTEDQWNAIVNADPSDWPENEPDDAYDLMPYDVMGER